MPWETNQITNYRLSIGTNTQPTISLFSGSRLLGWLSFREQPKKPKKSGGRYVVYFERPLYESAVDMLRNENPVFLQYFADRDPGKVHAHLSTANEPTGDGED